MGLWLNIFFSSLTVVVKQPKYDVRKSKNGGEIMKTSILKTIGRITENTFKILFYTGSFLIFVWIAGCLSLIAADYFSWNADFQKNDWDIVFLKR